MNKLRWGIIGPGKIAHQFAKDIKFVENAELIAVASKSIERSSSFAREYAIPYHFDSYEDLYNSTEVDAIYVATTHNFHLKNSIDAIKAGKAVLCEKPLTSNLIDTKELIKTAQESETYLMEAMWTYFLPAIRKAKEWVDSGRIGQIVNLKANFGYPKNYDPNSRLFNPELSGGNLLDMGIYPVAMAWYFLESEPQTYNVVMKKAESGVDSDVNMQLVYKNGLVANLHSSFQAKLNNHTYIIGEKGYIDIPDFWRSSECRLYKEEKIIDQFMDNRKGLGFEFQIEASSNDIIQGRLESAIMPHANSIKLQELMGNIMSHF